MTVLPEAVTDAYVYTEEEVRGVAVVRSASGTPWRAAGRVKALHRNKRPYPALAGRPSPAKRPSGKGSKGVSEPVLSLRAAPAMGSR